VARDYKNAKRAPAEGVPPWLAFASGLSLGLFVAFLVYLDGRVQRAPEAASGEAASGPPLAAAPEPEPEPTAQPALKPRFDFYTILPEMEVKVPDWQPATGGGEGEPTAAVEPSSHVLQVGSFQGFEEADKAKAELALLGISAEIQRVVINGQDVWYRVRVGPFSAIEELQRVRARLTEAGRDFMLLRIKSGEG